MSTSDRRRVARKIADATVPRRRRNAARWRRLEQTIPGGSVRSGPFAGAHFDRVTTGCDFPKRLGSYELELHQVIQSWTGYRRVIDVGCGEGWYIVGVARLLPEAEVLGFDISLAAQDASRENTRRNGVNAEIGGEITPAGLQERIVADTLLIVDIEGAEADLLDPVAVPALGLADLLVETHDFARPGVTELLVDRFSDRSDQVRALSESRPDANQWLWMPAASPS